jgi:hypothetical protein
MASDKALMLLLQYRTNWQFKTGSFLQCRSEPASLVTWFYQQVVAVSNSLQADDSSTRITSCGLLTRAFMTVNCAQCEEIIS